eukprot:jgi/Mesvir1/12390/Mv00564-RA.2
MGLACCKTIASAASEPEPLAASANSWDASKKKRQKLFGFSSRKPVRRLRIAILGLDGVGKTSLVLHILQESERTTDATSEAKQATKEGRGGGNPHSVGATSQGWEQRGAQGFLNGVPNGASRVGHQGTAGISTHLSASPGWQPPAPVNGTPPASSQGASVLQGAAWGHGAMGPNGAGPAPPHATPLEGASNCGAHHLLPPGVGSGDGGGAVANGAAVLGTSPGVEASPPFLPAPTTQLMRVQCTVHGIKVTLQEPPAQRSAREQWPKLVRGVDAVLFVVDATDVMRMPVARVELWQLAADMGERSKHSDEPGHATVTMGGGHALCCVGPC